MPAPTCTECGATDAFGSCDELFGTLLALDHSRREPWGPLHAIASACFHLQHPSKMAESGRAVQWAYLHHYLRGGRAALAGMTERFRRLNSHLRGGRRPDADDFDGVPAFPGGPPPKAYGTTIAEVSVDSRRLDPALGTAHTIVTGWRTTASNI